MFFFKLFCDTKEMHKLLIRESYDDYKIAKKKWKDKYPNLTGLVNINLYNNLNNTCKNEWIEYQAYIYSLKEILINNIISYCINYPDDKISKHRFINEYKEHPYKLEQNIGQVLLDL
jgi:hypothetical protein